MTTETLARLAGEVCRITGEAAALVRSMERPAVYEKEGHANFVTAADLASQEYLISHLAPLLPEASFFAEEGEHDGLPAGLCWLIDPIDGTTNFIRGARSSAISVGLVAGGEALLGVVRNLYTGEVFHAVRGGGAFADGEPIRTAATPLEKAIVMCGTTPYLRELAGETFETMQRIFLRCGDIRRSGSAALDLCSVAAGRSDGFYEARLSPWDFAASAAIIREAGGVITAGGEPLDFGKVTTVTAGSREVHDMIVSCLPSGGEG